MNYTSGFVLHQSKELGFCTHTPSTGWLPWAWGVRTLWFLLDLLMKRGGSSAQGESPEVAGSSR